VPDRFERFTNEELHELRDGIIRSRQANIWAARPEQAEICDKLDTEIAHTQEQREMAEARQRVIA
jgi:hypothetical protein